MNPAKVVPLHSGSKNSVTVAYGRHGTVQIFVGRERDYEDLRQGFERILAFRPRHNFMLLKLNGSADYVAEYVDCGPAAKQEPCDAGLFADEARQLTMKL